MDVINAYFGDIVFTKVEQKEGFMVYVASISSSYGDGKKQYALAMVQPQYAVKERAYLRDLQWQNLQTRLLQNGYRIPAQKWNIPRNLEMMMFEIVDRNAIRTKYILPNHPIEMILLHDPKKKTQYQYHNRMNIVAALSSFRCVISVIENIQRQVFGYSTNNIDDSFELL